MKPRLSPVTRTGETDAPYRSYGAWLREKFRGRRVFKVIVDAGFSCPNRDGTKGYGGCAYCNVETFTPSLPRSTRDIREQVARGIERARKHYKAGKFILYFQPNTNTHAPVDRLREVYDQALSVCPEDTVGLSVGTRPDCLDREKIALLEHYADRIEVDLEIGMESIHDQTLHNINRCCTHGELVQTLEQLAASPLHIGIHAILGLPGETRDMMLAYAAELNRFPQVRYIKLHHLHIVRGSILAATYQKNPFPLLSLEEYTDLLCEFLPLLRKDIIIQRLFAVADQELLIAPKWNMTKSAIQTILDREFRQRGMHQGSACGH